MKRRLGSVVAAFTLLVGLAPGAVLAAPIRTSALHPGETVTFRQRVPINVIFLGYERGQISTNKLMKQLPGAYEPVVRYPQFYGLEGRDMGLRYNFDYDVTFTGSRLENRFFRYLRNIGTRGDLTDYQAAYNDQENNVLDVRGPVLYIDAPSVEGWLADHLNQPANGYTIVFVNWHSRPDFRFHVYTKTDEPDPDTGYNFGVNRQTRKIIAWGGSHSRLWFYDLSAGPESWTDNWNVDDPDLDGNGAEDYRMPPVWEYARDGYRRPGELSSDLGLVARFVAINLLFTSSPLYDPLVTAPGPGGNRVVSMNMFEDDPASQGLDWINPAFAKARWAEFQPYYDWRTRLVQTDPIGDAIARALRIFSGVLEEDDCWNAYGDPFAELFCFIEENQGTYIPRTARNNYQIPVFNFNTTEETLGDQFGLLGFADDNWVDGTQTYVFSFGADAYRELGYGFTGTAVHEVGHHIGLSHPHDGYDSQLGIDYGPEDAFYFAWSGDESDSVMSYLDLSLGFGEFNQDNMYRWEFAGYMNWANGLLDDILADPQASQVADRIARADALASMATRQFRSWHYLSAATNARMAYAQIARAAAALGIETPTSMSAMSARIAGNRVPHEGDPIRHPTD
ncbi:MAG TPA: hypothetical protein VH987_07265 [Candidatus Limnocylindria bacterium]|jgi:hypothetical protein